MALLVTPASGPPVENAAAARAALEGAFHDLAVERLEVLFLGASGRILARGRHEGSAVGVVLPVQALIREAVARAAPRLIVAHNHPAGDPAPSARDIAATRRLAQGAALVGVRLVDHLIFAGGGCTSFRALGLL